MLIFLLCINTIVLIRIRTKITHMSTHKLFFIFLLAMSIGNWSCDEDLPPSIKINKEIFSVSDQKQLGDIFVEKYAIEHEDIILDLESNKSIYKYINQFNTLFTTPPVTRLDDFEWNITILNDSNVNLFTFPGGHIYITTGFLKHLNTESQLVAIISNAIYYCNSDVLVNKLVRNFGGVAMGDMFLGNIPEKYSPSEIVDFLIDVTFDEREVMASDEMTIDIVCLFEYDVNSIMKVLEESKNTVWMKRHSSSLNRMMKIETMIDDFNCGDGVTFEERYRKFTSILP